MKSTNQSLTSSGTDPIKTDPKIFTPRRNGRDNRHANYFVLLNHICRRFEIHKTDAIDFDIADELARELSEMIPSDVVLDKQLTVNEILEWAQRQEGPHSKPLVVPRREIDSVPSTNDIIRGSIMFLFFMLAVIAIIAYW